MVPQLSTEVPGGNVRRQESVNKCPYPKYPTRHSFVQEGRKRRAKSLSPKAGQLNIARDWEI